MCLQHVNISASAISSVSKVDFIRKYDDNGKYYGLCCMGKSRIKKAT